MNTETTASIGQDTPIATKRQQGPTRQGMASDRRHHWSGVKITGRKRLLKRSHQPRHARPIQIDGKLQIESGAERAAFGGQYDRFGIFGRSAERARHFVETFLIERVPTAPMELP